MYFAKTMLLKYYLLVIATCSFISVQSKFINKKGNIARIQGRTNRKRYDHSIRIQNESPFHKQKEIVRIHGGNMTDTQNYPYMAAIVINGRLWCAGAIVDTNWVLTAAHCLNYVLHVSPLRTLSKYVKVRVGSYKPFEGGTLIDVVGAVRHPKYEVEPVPHADIALLKLAENLEFHKNVNLIKISEGTTQPYAQTFVEVSGWGATRGSDTAFRDHASFLLSARLKVRPQRYCIDSYQLVSGLQFTKDFFCASLRNGTRDVCLFDAGAPAVQNNELMGVMSFGPDKCGRAFQPAVFIKAFYFRDFVQKTIASYKTSKELSNALKETDPEIYSSTKNKSENDKTEESNQDSLANKDLNQEQDISYKIFNTDITQ